MSANVASTPCARVRAPPMQETMSIAREFRQAGIERARGIAVPHEDPKQTRQIVAFPLAVQVRFRNRQRSPKHGMAKKPRPDYPQGRLQVGCVAERRRTARVTHRDLATTQPGELVLHNSLGQEIEIADVSGNKVTCCADHECGFSGGRQVAGMSEPDECKETSPCTNWLRRAAFDSGCGTNGTRFRHRRKACQ